MTTFTGIEHDSLLLAAIDEDFCEWMTENEIDSEDWCEFGQAIQSYKHTDRFLSHFFEGLKIESCIIYWTHYSPYLNRKIKEFIERM